MSKEHSAKGIGSGQRVKEVNEYSANRSVLVTRRRSRKKPHPCGVLILSALRSVRSLRTLSSTAHNPHSDALVGIASSS